MRCSLDELCSKEVINICDGRKLGRIDDLCIELCDGSIVSIVVPGRGKFFGLFKSEQECVIPYSKIVRFGTDVILVDIGN